MAGPPSPKQALRLLLKIRPSTEALRRQGEAASLSSGGAFALLQSLANAYVMVEMQASLGDAS